ncbi:MAG: hypothetical protein ACE5KZ_12540 [Candidatus Scalinduaceae bacterium]
MKKLFSNSVILIFMLFMGCANHLSSLNNNSSITVDRGLGVGVEGDPFTLVPKAYLKMGTNARIGKHDRVVITVNKNSTIITAENLNYEAEYNDQGKLIHEVRGKNIQIKKQSDDGVETTTTNLKGELKGPITFQQKNKGIFPDETGVSIGE